MLTGLLALGATIAPLDLTNLEIYLDPTNVTLDSQQYKRVQVFGSHADQNISATCAAPSQAQYPDVVAFPDRDAIYTPSGTDLTFSGGASTDWDFLSAPGWTYAERIRMSSDTGTYQRIANTRGATENGITILYDKVSTGQLWIVSRNTIATNYYDVRLGPALQANTDYLIIIRWDGTTMRAEINGVDYSNTPTTTGTESAAGAQLQLGHQNGAGDFVGYRSMPIIFSRAVTDSELPALRARLSGSMSWTETQLITHGPSRLGLWELFLPSGMTGNPLTAWAGARGVASVSSIDDAPAVATDAALGGINSVTLIGSDRLKINAWQAKMNTLGASAFPMAGVDAVFSAPTDATLRYVDETLGLTGPTYFGMRLGTSNEVRSIVSDDAGHGPYQATRSRLGERYCNAMGVRPYTVSGNTVQLYCGNDVDESVNNSSDLGIATYGNNHSMQGTTTGAVRIAKKAYYELPRNRGEVLACLRAIGAGTGGGY